MNQERAISTTLTDSTPVEKLRVGLVSSTSVTLAGGEQRFNGHLIRGFQELGHQAVLFNAGPPADGFQGAEIHNLNQPIGVRRAYYWLEHFRAPVRRIVASTGALSPWLTTQYLHSSARRMGQMLSTKPTCDFYLAAGGTAPMACHYAGVPYAMLCLSMAQRTYEHMFRTHRMPASVRRHFVRRVAEMELAGIQGAKAWLANSLDTQEYLQELASVDPVTILWSPVEPDEKSEIPIAEARGEPRHARRCARGGDRRANGCHQGCGYNAEGRRGADGGVPET